MLNSHDTYASQLELMGDTVVREVSHEVGTFAQYHSSTISLPNSTDRMSRETLSTRDGPEMVVFSFDLNAPLIVRECPPMDKVTLTLTARGMLHTQLDGSGREWTEGQGRATLSSSHGERERWVKFEPEHQRNVLIQINMSADEFASFTKSASIPLSTKTLDLLHSEDARIVDHRQLSPRSGLVLDQIVAALVSPSVRPHYLLGKMWEILALYADEFRRADRPAPKKMGSAVIDRIAKVRKIILSDLAEGHTIPDLADAVMLSQSTLTHGFRNYYGTSIHAFITEQRLDWAHKLITADPERNVSDVAYEVGFGCPSRFSAVFAKRFGVFPNAYRKSLLPQL